MDQKVIIVEDRPAIAVRLRRAVDATEGIAVAGVASTLDQGLNLLYEIRPRVALVDIGLPDGSGIDLVSAAAQADWSVDSMIVSIFGDEARIVRAIQAGARGYILKSGDLSGIGGSILSLLQGGSPISPSIARHLLDAFKSVNPSQTASKKNTLTRRETEILRLVSYGYKRREIADKLGLSPGTVGNHINNIYRKMEVRSNMQAVAQASREGIL